jgi:hypothetical protein
MIVNLKSPNYSIRLPGPNIHKTKHKVAPASLRTREPICSTTHSPSGFPVNIEAFGHEAIPPFYNTSETMVGRVQPTHTLVTEGQEERVGRPNATGIRYLTSK